MTQNHASEMAPWQTLSGTASFRLHIRIAFVIEGGPKSIVLLV